jgi:hypothetical protein
VLSKILLHIWQIYARCFVDDAGLVVVFDEDTDTLAGITICYIIDGIIVNDI